MSDETTLKPAPDGPYIVKNLQQLTGPDDRPLPAKATIALCRCGASKKKPHCDGTHAAVGFTGARQADRVPDERRSFAGARITIHDNRGLCAHAGVCTDALPQVFEFGSGIKPDAADPEAIIAAIARCPSGALSYSIDGVEHRDLDRPVAIHVSPHGPYNLEGGVVLQGAPSLEGASAEHRSLCRCGGSHNKPFCDGSHWAANFHDDDKHRVALVSETGGDPIEVQVEGVALVVTGDGKTAAVRTADGRAVGAQVHPRWGEVLVDLKEIRALGAAGDAAAPSVGGGNREEPFNELIHELAAHGLERVGSHGPMGAMGVPRYQLPSWNAIQIVTAQLHRAPQLDDAEVDTRLVVGPRANKPLELAIPIIVSDMSFGALSIESKVALSKGAELAGTGICSGEGGMLPEEQRANSRYFYELASARFGFSTDLLSRVQAFHFKCGQGAKTGTGGHLPGHKVTEKIAAVRGLAPGQDAISPARFPDWTSPDQFAAFAAEVRELTGGIPIGFKLSAQHVEQDIDAALAAGADYLILDGRGGGTGAAPLLFRDNISVPTIPALARARRHLDAAGARDVTLFITGGLRTAADFVKALALGADGIAVANAAIQAIGCQGARICNTNRCPAGIATQDPALRALFDVEQAALRLHRFLQAVTHMMCTLARACGHTKLSELSVEDLTTFDHRMARLSGVAYGGVG